MAATERHLTAEQNRLPGNTKRCSAPWRLTSKVIARYRVDQARGAVFVKRDMVREWMKRKRCVGSGCRVSDPGPLCKAQSHAVRIYRL